VYSLSVVLGDGDVMPSAVAVCVHVGLEGSCLTVSNMHHYQLTTNQRQRHGIALSRLSITHRHTHTHTHASNSCVSATAGVNHQSTD